MESWNSTRERKGARIKPLLCVLIFLGTHSTALAEERYKLNEVIFGASGFEREIVDAPASISVIPKEDLEKKPVKDIAEAVADVPGVDVTLSKTGTYDYSIRGFDSSYVLVLVDGKRRNISKGFDRFKADGKDSDFLPPLSMIERIEVIRGPSSSLYGSDALGGVINIITKKNPSKTEASVGFNTLLQQHSNKYGNAGGIDAYVATPIVEDKLSISARFKYYDKGTSDLKYPTTYDKNGNIASQRDHIAHHSTGAFNSLGLGTRLNWTINDANNVYLDLERYVNEVAMNDIPLVVRRVFKDNVVLNHDGNYDFGTTNSYVQYSNTKNSDDRHSRFWTGESKVILPLDLGSYGNMLTSLGMKIDREDLKLPDSTGKNLKKKGQTIFAIYGEDEYFITDRLIFTLGLRYVHSDLFGSQLTPRVYLVYHVNDSIALRGGVARGYKTPGVAELSEGYYNYYPNRAYLYGNPDLKPEKSVNYELGVNFDMADFAYSSITGFITNFDNQIGLEVLKGGDVYGIDCSSRSCRKSINLGKTQIKGLELAFNTKPWNGFKVNSSYTFMDSRYKGRNKNLHGGDRIMDVPRHVLMLKLGYERGKFDFWIKGKARMDTVLSRRTLYWDKYRDFYVVDLGIDYKIDKQSSLNFSIQNLFDKNFLDPIIMTGTLEKPTRFWNHYQDFTEGRSFWISYKHNF